jgi:hypothetical protein
MLQRIKKMLHGIYTLLGSTTNLMKSIIFKGKKKCLQRDFSI